MITFEMRALISGDKSILGCLRLIRIKVLIVKREIKLINI